MTTTTVRKVLSVACYTRKSTVKGLDKALSTLEAQRAACAAYVETQRAAGWQLLDERYDDGGFSGSNTDRPAFRRLMADVQAGRIDIVVAYKLDRLSRSQLDLLQTLCVLEEHGVAFASATEPISTATPAGRMMVGILSAFAQMQREVIVERTKDKAAAEKRAGLWLGGRCPLGYDVVQRRLVVNDEEASRVRTIFQRFLQVGAMPLVDELHRNCWFTKRTVYASGKVLGGGPFDKGMLYKLLRNPAYVGKVRVDDELIDAHPPIVDEETWNAVQRTIDANNAPAAGRLRSCWSAPLKGLVKCGLCGAAYTHVASPTRGRKHRYYACLTRRGKGVEACAGGSASAAMMEDFVVDQIRGLGSNEQLLAQTLEAAQAELRVRLPEREAELARLRRDGAGLRTQQENLVAALAGSGAGKGAVSKRLDQVATDLHRVDERVEAVQAEIAQIRDRSVDADDLRAAVAAFDRVWDHLSMQERGQLLHLLIEVVVYDSEAGDLAITFRDAGLKLLGRKDRMP